MKPAALYGSLRHPFRADMIRRRVTMKTQISASGGVGLGRGGRMSRQRKRDTVLRMLRGEDLETLSRALGVTAATLTGWQDTFVAAGEARDPVRHVPEGLAPEGLAPEGLARGRLHEGGDVQPLVAVVTQCDRPLTFGRPHPAEDRLQPNAVLIRGPALDRRVRVLASRRSDNGLQLFLNASRSSGVAEAGWRGRGFCTDQLIALSASQPRWGN